MAINSFLMELDDGANSFLMELDDGANSFLMELDDGANSFLMELGDRWVLWELGQDALAFCALEDVGEIAAPGAERYDGENWYRGELV
jgi:hypothetical protein